MPHRPHNFRALSKPKQIHKNQHSHYWPYIPLLLMIVGSMLLSTVQATQKHGVLAYATNTSIDGLLTYTNQQRTQNGVSSLQLNQSLTSAAQSKANDMITRNYWSHNTPDGQEPWIFINNAGYKYQRAGENLAYGFGTSDDTITGWMNSPTHRDNLLDSEFVEVGFGFANGQDFNNSGPETVVVAMYGKPQVLAASNQASPAPNPVANTPSLSSTPAVQADPAPIPTTSTVPDTPTTPPNQLDMPVAVIKPVTTYTPITGEPPTKNVARIQTLTRGNASWSLFAVGTITGIALVLILMKHAVGLRHILRNSEHFVLHHPLLDTTLVSLVILGSFMSHTTGFIR